VSQAQARIREAVTRNPGEKLTALLHHVTVETLRSAFLSLKKRAAVGVDQVRWVDYAADLDRNLTDLHARVHSGAYRALPSRRVFIPKADGKLRPRPCEAWLRHDALPPSRTRSSSMRSMPTP
jgi:RNA-directed DNA polymerase